MPRRRPETRAEERARGYFRPAAREGVTEYARRTRGLTGEARARAAGKRGPAELGRLIKGGRVISADIGKGRDDKHASVRVLTTDGKIRRYDVAGGKKMSKTIDRLAGAGVEIRRYPEQVKK